MQPDTIIPDLSNPQSWNRYSYVTNRPINFSDPTGHRETDDLMSGGEPCLRGDLSCQLGRETDEQKEEREQRKKRVHDAVDGLIWRIVPSAIGIDFGVQGQYGFLAEAEVTPIEIQILYNWRSKQLSVFKGSGTGGYLGSPNMLGFTGYLGIMTVKGASDNRYVAGKSLSLGATAQVDAIGKAGVSKVIGASWDTKTKMPFVDPVSKVPVYFQQTNIIGGANIFPDAFDVGVFAGESDSEMISPP